MNEQIAGHCGKCGAPYYLPFAWWGITPPSPTPTCACWNIPQTVTSTKLVLTTYSPDITDEILDLD